MDTESFITQYGIWGVLLYIVIKEGIPLIQRVFELTLPEASRRKQVSEQRLYDLEVKRLELRERETIALESINKTLVLLDSRMNSQDTMLNVVSSGISSANQALAIILDRVHRRREDYTGENKTIDKSKGENVR